VYPRKDLSIHVTIICFKSLEVYYESIKREPKIRGISVGVMKVSLFAAE
jgi:hypothetical protein